MIKYQQLVSRTPEAKFEEPFNAINICSIELRLERHKNIEAKM